MSTNDLDDMDDIGTAKDPATGGPVETKVAASTGGAGVGVVLGALVVYLLDQLVYTPGSQLGDEVPLVVMTAVTVLLGALGAFFAGWRAPHTSRRGENALAGPQGPAGPMGLRGEQGPAGPPGPPGRDGKDGYAPTTEVRPGYLGEPRQTGDPIADDSPYTPGGMG